MKQLLHRLFPFWISGVLLVGCNSTPPIQKQKAPAKPGAFSLIASNTPPIAKSGEDENEDEFPKGNSTGNAESLARYAAGISFGLNDKDDQALEQFYLSALSDPTNEPLVLEVSRAYLAKKHPEKAVTLLKKSAERPQVSPNILIWLGQATFHQGNTNEALTVSKSVIKRYPENLSAYESLFGIYLTIGRTNEASQLLAQASKKARKPDDFIRCGEMAGYYLKKFPDDTSVRTQGTKVLDEAAGSKSFPDALMLPLAQAYEHLGEPLKSADIYLKIMGSDTTPSVKRDALREKLADIYLRAKDNKRATEQLRAIVRDNPTHYPQAWLLLGQLAMDSGELTEADSSFREALVLDPSLEQAYYELALVQIDLRKNTEALVTLDKAREKFQHTFLCEFLSGMAYARLKNFPEAIKYFTVAESLGKLNDPKRLNKQFYFQFGAAYERNQQFKEAADYFEKCLAIAPDYDEAMNYLGYMWAERGENLEKAHELISKALKKEPKNAAYLDSMGWVLYQKKKPDEAISWLLKAQELSEEPDATLFEHIADAYIATGQIDKAREALKKSLQIESNEEVKKKLDRLTPSGR